MGITTVAKALLPRPVKMFLRRALEGCQNLPGVHGTLKKYHELMSRHYYGNTLLHWANVQGRRNWAAAKRAFRGPVDRALHEEFMRVGYVNLSSAAEPHTIRRLQREFAAAITNPQLSYDPYDDPDVLRAYNHGNYQGPLDSYRRQLRDPFTGLPGYRQIFNDRLISALESCLASHFQIEEFAAYRNSHVPPHILRHFEPHSSRWHFDDQIADGMRLFVYLSDVSAGHGPFECFDRDYSRFLLKKGFSKQARRQSVTGGLAEDLFDTPRLKKHTGPAGSLVLCASSFCLHRAGDLDAGNYRDALALTLRPSCARTRLSTKAAAA